MNMTSSNKAHCRNTICNVYGNQQRKHKHVNKMASICSGLYSVLIELYRIFRHFKFPRSTNGMKLLQIPWTITYLRRKHRCVLAQLLCYPARLLRKGCWNILGIWPMLCQHFLGELPPGAHLFSPLKKRTTVKAMCVCVSCCVCLCTAGVFVKVLRSKILHHGLEGMLDVCVAVCVCVYLLSFVCGWS